VISAIREQFQYYCEFERFQGHPLFIKIAGVRYIVVLINKMDDPTVNWNQAIYEEIKHILSSDLKKCGLTCTLV
jgi:peptide chain release factor subunit 3